MTQQSGPFGALFEEYKAGRVSRREFLPARPCSGSAPRSRCSSSIPSLRPSPAQDATPAAGGAAAPSRHRRTDPRRRRRAQDAPVAGARRTSASTPRTGTKDQLGASLVLEPLINFLPDGTLIPTLVKEVPTRSRTAACRGSPHGHLQPAGGRALERRRAVHRR